MLGEPQLIGRSVLRSFQLTSHIVPSDLTPHSWAQRQHQEEKTMAAVINETRAIDVPSPVASESTQMSDATQIARYCTLEELPGLVFGIMTVVYIVLSLTSLAP
jgi:hypothetical protein